MTGREPEIADSEILNVFIKTEDPVLTAPEIAEKFGYSTSGIYKRLKRLQEESLLDSKKVGQGRAWWITNEGKNRL